MGLKKVIIKRLECMKARQTKYSKRKKSILKKAKELSILCDVDLALIMFSPAGKPSLYVGQNKELLSLVDRLARMSVADREQRRVYTMELLKKIYVNHTEVDSRNFTLDKSDFLEFQQSRLCELNEKIAEKTKILSEWNNPQNIMDLRKIEIMENHLALSLEDVKAKKRELIIRAQEQEQHVRAFQQQRENLQGQMPKSPQVQLREPNLQQQGNPEDQTGHASQVHLIELIIQQQEEENLEELIGDASQVHLSELNIQQQLLANLEEQIGHASQRDLNIQEQEKIQRIGHTSQRELQQEEQPGELIGHESQQPEENTEEQIGHPSQGELNIQPQQEEHPEELIGHASQVHLKELNVDIQQQEEINPEGLSGHTPQVHLRTESGEPRGANWASISSSSGK